LTSDQTELLGWLRDRQGEMTELLTALAEAESPSLDGEAQASVRTMLRDEFTELGFEVEQLPGAGGCDHLLATLPAGSEAGSSQLLLGHFDTVWALGTLERMPVTERDGRLHGPGVFDMKGGLVQLLYALRANAEFGVEMSCRPVIFLNADEEIGSPDSRRHTIGLAGEAARVLVMEPSYGPLGRLKTGRKGVGRFTLKVTGVASHAGLNPEGGASAILEVSHQIERLFELNDAERGVTVNVGTIDGGMRANVVAPEAVAEIEARVVTAEDAVKVEQAIRGLEPTGDRLSLAVEGEFGRPPLEMTPRNRRLWERARQVAAGLGLEIEDAQVGGASDGNLTSPHTATLDGLGAVGDGAHAEHEHVVLERMPERAALIAGLLASPPDGMERSEG